MYLYPENSKNFFFFLLNETINKHWWTDYLQWIRQCQGDKESLDLVYFLRAENVNGEMKEAQEREIFQRTANGMEW